MSLLLGAVASGQVSVTFTTHQTQNPTYAPKNIVAVWVEDAAGQFVATPMLYANTRKQYLRAWNAASGGVVSPDAITGATRGSHGELVASWNLKDVDGNPVDQGVYTIRMEVTDHNAGDASSNNEGQVTVQVDDSGEQTAVDDNGGFTGITLDYTPEALPTPDAGPVGTPDAAPQTGCEPNCAEPPSEGGVSYSGGGCSIGAGAGGAWVVLLALLAARRRSKKPS